MWTTARAFRDHPTTVREIPTAASLVEHACHPPSLPPRPDRIARTTSCGRACPFRPTAHARHTAASVSKTCQRRRESAVAVGADSIDGLGTSFVLMIPSNLGAVTAVSSMARCRQAMWVHDPGLADPLWCARVRVCVWVPGCQLCFLFSAAAITSLGMLPPSPKLRAMASVAPFRREQHVQRRWASYRHTQLPCCSCDNARLRGGLHGIITFGATGPLPPRKILHTNGTLVSVRRTEFSGEGNLTIPHLHWWGWAGRWLGQASEKGDMLPPPSSRIIMYLYMVLACTVCTDSHACSWAARLTSGALVNSIQARMTQLAGQRREGWIG